MGKIYIVSQSEKRVLLDYKKKHLGEDFDIVLDNELKDGIIGKLSDAAIIYLKKQGYSFSNAKKIKNLVLTLKDVKCDIDFKKYYDEFNKLGYIEKNPYYEEYLKSNEIYLSPVCNNVEIKSLLNGLPYKTLDISTNGIKRDMYDFKTLEESALALFTLILEKIKSGVKETNIKVVNSSPEFMEILKSYNKFYGFPFVFEKEIKKNLFKIYKTFKENLVYKKLNEVLLELQDEDLIKEFIDIYVKLNKFCSDEEIIEYIDFYVQNNKKVKEKGSIKFVDKSYIPLEGEVLFIPSFVSSVYPNPKSDSSYPGDKEFKSANLLTSNDENEIEKLEFKEVYYSKGEVVFLKHKIHLKNEYFKSVYEDTYSFENKKIESKIISKDALRLNLVLNEDRRLLYGKKNPYKKQLEEEVSEYRTYDHHFKPFDEVKNDRKVELSFTTLNDFISCPFKYYLTNILRVDKFKDTNDIRLGNVFHEFIENNLKNIDYDIDYYLDKFPSKKEKIINKKLFKGPTKAYEVFEEFLNSSKLKKFEIEKKFKFDLNSNVVLKGAIDTIIFDDENKYLAVIDYKKSDKNFDKKYVENGEYLQLPTYLLALKHIYKDYTPLGSYFYNVAPKDYLLKDIDNSFKFSGVSRIEDECRNILDSEGKYIRSIKPSKEGKFRTEKGLVDEEGMKELIDVTYDQINDSALKIKKGEFNIGPRYFNKSACEYCNYKDICYVEGKDEVKVLVSDEEEEE